MKVKPEDRKEEIKETTTIQEKKDVDLKLKTTPQFEEFPFEQQTFFYVMTSIIAPTYIPKEGEIRAPIDLVCVIDKSGSMGGEKIRLVKESLLFMIDQLKSGDRLSIVSFDSSVKVEINLTDVDEKGKITIMNTVKKLEAGTSTNLSGGLFKGFEVVRERKNPQEVASIILFTDGLANVGLTKTQDIVLGMENEIKKLGKSATVFTFGFGEDHDANMLRGISQAGKGVYYYVKKEEEIPSAFADCLGGLLSIVSQNIKLTISTKGSTKIVKALTTYKSQEIEKQKVLEINLGDLYSEEKKDIVIILDVPKIEAESEKHEIFECELSYFNAILKDSTKILQSGYIKRPKFVENLKPNYELDKQRNRVETTSALDEARILADKNLLSDAREVLNKMINSINNSISAQDDFCKQLVKDLKSLLDTFVDTKSYTSFGNKMVNNMWISHEYQRSNNQDCDDDNSSQTYMNVQKKEMKMKSKNYFSKK